MEQINLKDIIAIIPDILQYFVSGFIFVFIYKTLCSKKIEASMQLIGSCVVSFVWVSLIKAVNEIWLHNCMLDNLWVIVAISVLLSLITALGFSKIFVSDWFHKIAVSLFGVTPHSSVWDNIIRSSEGAAVKVYLKGKDFYWAGALYSYEDNGNDSWFCISKQTKYNMKNEMTYTQGESEGAYLVFNIKDVESVEIFKS